MARVGLARARKMTERRVKEATWRLKVQVARALLNQANMDVPVKTGKLLRSGATFVGRRLVAGGLFDGRFHHMDKLRKDPSWIQIVYSAPKRATKGANVFYVKWGVRWFDYAPYQHEHHLRHRLWLKKVMREWNLLKVIRGFEK